MNLESGVMQIHIEDIIPNRFQPRLQFDEEGLKELADSIKEHGIIQPLVLRKLGNKYEIIAGERRYKAATMAGLTTVPAVIANVDDNKAAEVAIVENVQRRDLTAIEEARSYKNLLDKGYLTQEQLAKRMGLSQPAIANKLRLLNLDEEVQQALLDEKISERHARTLLSIKDKEEQKEWLHRIINERLTVRQLDLELKKSQPDTTEDEDAEDGGDVPIVEDTKNIADIKANATDIHDLNRKMTADDLMKPTEVVNEEIEKLDDPLTNKTTEEPAFDVNPPTPMKDEEEPSEEPAYTIEMPTAEPAADDNFVSASSVNEPSIIEPSTTSNFVSPDNQIESRDDNKFFNFSPAVAEPTPEPTPEDNFIGEQNDNNFEVYDEKASSNLETTNLTDNPFLAFQQEKEEQQDSSSPQPQELNTDFDRNPNNKFFTPVYDENAANMTIENKNQDEVVDPMSTINRLTPEYQAEQQNNEKLTLKDAITSIRNNIEDLGNKGFYINVEEIDFDENYQITIQIKKDN